MSDTIPGAPGPAREVMITVKLTADERREIQRLADRHAGGSLSAWVRYAALSHRPKKGAKR